MLVVVVFLYHSSFQSSPLPLLPPFCLPNLNRLCISKKIIDLSGGGFGIFFTSARSVKLLPQTEENSDWCETFRQLLGETW